MKVMIELKPMPDGGPSGAGAEAPGAGAPGAEAPMNPTAGFRYATDGTDSTTEGGTTEGDTTEGDTTEGDTTEGGTTEGSLAAAYRGKPSCCKKKPACRYNC